MLFLVATLALGPSLARAQETPALAASPVSGPAIVGTVRSERGPIAGATVSLTGPTKLQAATTASGAFAFVAIPAGTYRLSVSAGGYDPVKDTIVTTDARTPQTLSVVLTEASLGSLRVIGSTVTAGRSTTINRSGAAQSTLTSQDFLDRGDAQVQNLLEELPGVELTRASSGGAPGANTNVAVRGASTYETQTLIDGHPITGGRFSTLLIQFLNPLVLGSIEVDKGPGVFGTTIQNAIGGTVNFRTPEITPYLSGRFTGGYDSYNGSTYSARVSDTIGKVGFLAAYGFNGTPGYFSGNILSVTSATGDSVKGQAPPLAVVNTAIPSTESLQNRAQVFKLAYNFSPVTSLTLGEINEQTYVDYTATLTTAEPFTIVPCIGATGPNCANATGYTNPAQAGYIGKTVLASDTADNLYLGNYELDNEPLFTVDLRTKFGPGSFLGRYYAGSITRDIDDPEEATQIIGCPTASCTTPTLDSAFYQRELDYLHGADFEYGVPLGRDLRDLAQVSYDQHSDRAQYCTGSSGTFTASNCSINNLLLTSRTFSIRALAQVAPKVQVGFGNYFSDTTFVGSRYDPRASIVWTPQRNTALRFAVGTAYVAPPANFVAPVPGQTKAIVNNVLYVADALKPETSAGVDLGADFGVHTDSKFTFDIYRTALTDRFSTTTVRPGYTIPKGGSFGTYNGMPFNSISEVYNASDAVEQGIEFSYVRSPRTGFGGLVNFDLLRAYNYNTVVPSIPGFNISGSQTGTIGGDGSETPGFQIPGFPYSHGRAEISYRLANSGKFTFGATVYGANNSFGEPGFTLFDFNTQLPLQNGLRLQASVSNLFNHDDYRTLGEYAYGYLPPGESTPYSLFFAPPRRVNLQLVYPFGGR
jgi:outer membrane receptor protein involved in Fe transport